MAESLATGDFPDGEMAAVVRRLNRAGGQLAAVVRMIEEGRSCQEVVTQLAAVSSAVDRAGFAIIASGLRRCAQDPDGDHDMDVATLEKLFFSLA